MEVGSVRWRMVGDHVGRGGGLTMSCYVGRPRERREWARYGEEELSRGQELTAETQTTMKTKS
jgi:hypothetical protein